MRRMKIAEFARLTGVSPRQVRTWIEKGALRVERLAPKVGVRILVDETDGLGALGRSRTDRRSAARTVTSRVG